MAVPRGAVKKLIAEVEDNEDGIPSADRPRLIREAEERIFGLEVVEEKLVMAALDAGLECHRRIDAIAVGDLGLRRCGGGSASRGGGVRFPSVRLVVAMGGPLRRCPENSAVLPAGLVLAGVAGSWFPLAACCCEQHTGRVSVGKVDQITPTACGPSS